MPCIKHMHYWHNLPAQAGKPLLLLVENIEEPARQWMVTGVFDAEINHFISALPTKHLIESDRLKVIKWTLIRFLPPAKRGRR